MGYVMRANAGFEVGFHGVYREIVPGERIVWTEIFEAMPGEESVNTLTFTERDGRTTATLLVRSESTLSSAMATGRTVGSPGCCAFHPRIGTAWGLRP